MGGDRAEVAALRDVELAAFRNRTVGFVFQAYNLLGHLSAMENVILPARFSDAPPDIDRAREVLADVAMADRAHRKPGSLSGGERQRVAIARALYNRPKLLLCDEPTGNLDGKTGGEILELFARLADGGTALLIATHDSAIAGTASRIVQLNAGRLS